MQYHSYCCVPIHLVQMWWIGTHLFHTKVCFYNIVDLLTWQKLTFSYSGPKLTVFSFYVSLCCTNTHTLSFKQVHQVECSCKFYWLESSGIKPEQLKFIYNHNCPKGANYSMPCINFESSSYDPRKNRKSKKIAKLNVTFIKHSCTHNQV